MSWNVQGMNNKIDYVCLLADKFNLDVITISEHWFTADESTFVFVPGYETAAFYGRFHHIHGGAAIFIKDNCQFSELSCVREMSVEMICEAVAIKIHNLNTIILSVYRPYNDDVTYFNAFLDCLFDMLCAVYRPNFNLIIGADFNVKFTSGDVFEQDLLNLFRCFGIEITTTDITRPGLINVGACIDNVVTDYHPSLFKCSVVHTILSDHNAILFEARIPRSTINESRSNANQNKVRIVNQGNINLFLNLLSSINWFDVYVCDGDKKFKTFLNLYLMAVNSAFPLVNSKQNKSKSDNRWFTGDLKKLKERCDTYYSLFKIFQLQDLKDEYNCLKREYRKAVKKAKVAYFSNLIDSSHNKSKTMWNVVNRLSGVNGRSKASDNCSITAEHFNEYFIGHINNLSNNIPKSNSDSDSYLSNVNKHSPNFTFRCFSVEQVHASIMKLSNSKCLDIYGLNSFILKISSSFISEILTYLFNDCILKDLEFPAELKNVKVIPIHKKGKRNDPSNFRPISIVPIFSKVVENLMQLQLSNHFEGNNLFSEKQFGFRPNHSTSKAVLDLTNQLITDVENKCTVGFRSFDMSKAFDTVHHSVLINKLKYYGFSPESVQVIYSYLSDRKQFVFKDGTFSSSKSVLYGVPQGSILGPILFNIYINDLPSSIANSCREGYLFADDLGLKIRTKTNLQLQNQLEVSTVLINDWCSANNLSLNLSKICDISFSFSSRPIENNRSSLKFLGITLDSDLSWHEHVESVKNKLSKGLFLLCRLRDTVSNVVLLNVYHAQIYSYMSYGIAVWGNSSKSIEVFKLQKRAVRIICNVPRRTHCKPLFIKLGILSLPSIYILSLLLYVHTNLEIFTVNSDVHSHNTRNKDSLRTQFYHYSKSQKNWFYTSIKLYNALPSHVKSLPHSQFKAKLKSILIAKCLYNVDEFETSVF